MQRSRYTHIAKQVFPYSQESTTGSLHKCTIPLIISRETYLSFGESRKILLDNETEFKNQLFESIAQELGVQYKKYAAPYHPLSNGKIEGFHNFLKACLPKHISYKLEWDDVVPLACTAYNFIPNENSRELPFFLLLARDPILPLNTLLQPKVQYMSNDDNIISLEAMKSMFKLVVVNLKNARVQKDPKHFPNVTKLKIGDMVMVKNHTAKPFDVYVGDYQIVKLVGHKVHLQPCQGGHVREEHLDHIKYVLPADRYISAVPYYEWFGRKVNLRMNPKNIPDLQWDLMDKLHTLNIRAVPTTPQEKTEEVHEIVEINTMYINICSYIRCKIDHNTYIYH